MKTAAAFQIRVESEATPGGLEMPRRFRLDGRTIEIVENIDQWQSADIGFPEQKRAIKPQLLI
jgi:hypothetical protein